jgi:hypothetical protein
MNHIARLRLELAASRAAYEALEAGLHRFWTEATPDVAARINEIAQKAQAAADEIRVRHEN